MISRFLSEFIAVQSAVPMLLYAALKGAILVALAAAAAYALRNRSAASRHAVWTAAVVGHLTIPVLMLVLPAWSLPVLPAAPWMQAEQAPGARTTPSANAVSTKESAAAAREAERGSAFPAKTLPATPTAPSRGGSLELTPVAAATDLSPVIIMAAIWLAGALFVLLRLAVGTWRVTRLAREGDRVEDGQWLSLTQRLANRLGVTRPLTLLRGERLAVPVTWGIVYPAVLLPQDSDEWTEERKRFVLVHEMAHVKRFDALTQLVAQLAVAVFWFDPLVWFAAHKMRVEREHACDDYVLRDGTTPSLYAGELLEMVRSIGTPTHDRAAPAFAALAMARRSEFEGRMLSILDPRQDRHTLHRRGTFMTAFALAFLVLPLAALRPFEQPSLVANDFPKSFKVSILDASGSSGAPSSTALPAAGAQSPAPAPRQTTKAFSLAAHQSRWSCDAYPVGTVLHGRSSHISESDDRGAERLDFLVSEPGRCTEAAMIGKAVFSDDERHIARLAPGGFARFRERTASADRSVSIVPVGDGSLSYTAYVNGRTVPFDNAMAAWLSELLPQVVREVGMNVPERVARLRARGGVSAVLQEISRIHSSSSKTLHYKELIKNGPALSAADAERIAQQVGRDLTSSGDLSSILRMLPRSAVQSPAARKAVGDALDQISSSGDKASTLQFLAPNADPQMLLLLAKAAETLPSSGDKANFLLSTASEYLTPREPALRAAFFRTASTLQSSGDMANVLLTAIPYGHGNPDVTLDVVEGSKGLRSSGDTQNVLLSLVSQHLLKPQTTRATLGVIERTLTMGSSGDRANVLMAIGQAKLLSNAELRDAYIKAAMALPSDGDRSNVLAVAARQ